MEETAGQHLSSGSTLTSSLQSTTSNSGNSEAVQEQLTVTEHHSGAEGIPGTIKALLSRQHAWDQRVSATKKMPITEKYMYLSVVIYN